MEQCKHEWIPGGNVCGKCAAIRDVKISSTGIPSKPTDTISRRDMLTGMAMQGLLGSDFLRKYDLVDSEWKRKNKDGTAIDESNALAIESIRLADALIARLDGEEV